MIRPSRAIEIKERWDIFRALTPYFGRRVPARFIQRTGEKLASVRQIHPLIEGIYKPKDQAYCLSIASMLKNPYSDRSDYNPDGSWFFYYSPKSGSLESAVNQSLFNCMKDGEPVITLKQLSDKTGPNGAAYRILGLGLIESFDSENSLFKIRQVTIEEIQSRLNPNCELLDDNLIETALQLESLERWNPFVAENRAVYRVSKVKRDRAFRRIVLDNYNETCAVTGSKFVHGSVVEAEAAHVIGKDVNGTDDPRNGIALSHSAHWAFDKGIFTLSDQFEVIVHDKAKSADHRHFPIIEKDRKTILLPGEESNFPHPEALAWHREEVFGKFAR
jgi:hypothetical protein